MAKLGLTLCDPMDCSTLGFPDLHYLLEFARTYVHWVNDAIQLCHPLLPPSPPAFNVSQHQNSFQWVSSLYQVVKVLEHQLFFFKPIKCWKLVMEISLAFLKSLYDMRDSGEIPCLEFYPQRFTGTPIPHVNQHILRRAHVGWARLIPWLGPSWRALGSPKTAEGESGSRERGGLGTRDSFMIQLQSDPVRRLFSCSKGGLFIWKKPVYCLFCFFFFFNSWNFLFPLLNPMESTQTLGIKLPPFRACPHFGKPGWSVVSLKRGCCLCLAGVQGSCEEAGSPQRGPAWGEEGEPKWAGRAATPSGTEWQGLSLLTHGVTGAGLRRGDWCPHLIPDPSARSKALCFIQLPKIRQFCSWLWALQSCLAYSRERVGAWGLKYYHLWCQLVGKKMEIGTGIVGLLKVHHEEPLFSWMQNRAWV